MQAYKRWLALEMALVGVFLAAQGCAVVADPLLDVSAGDRASRAALVSAQSGFESIDTVLGEDSPSALLLAQDEAAAFDFTAAAADSATEGEDEAEFYDPFAEEEGIPAGEFEEYDPLEPYNVLVFRFNYNLDKFVVKPIAQGYNFVVPNVVQRGIFNAIRNIRVVPRLFNNLFQGKVRGAGIEVSRFLINTTVGIGGLFDPADNWFDLNTPPEDFGQTLGVYGVGPGPYFLLPIWPSPMTLRDGIGTVVDFFLDPFYWLVLPFVEISGAPQAVTHIDTATIANIGMRVGDALNTRSLNLETFQGVEEATVDLYSAVRNGYLQRRARAILE